MRREPCRWRTPLGRLVTDIGVQALTRALASEGYPVTQKAVYHWMSGRHAPRIHHAAAIARVSGGLVTIEDVYAQQTASVIVRRVR